MLALVGVPPDEIAADYELSATRLAPVQVARFLATPSRVNARSPEEFRADLAVERRRRELRSDREAILATLASIDVDAHLRASGLDRNDLDAARARLL